MIGACQNAVLRSFASNTVTWQRYSPGSSFPSEKLKLSGIVFNRLAVVANRRPVSNLDGLRKAIGQGKVALLEVNRHGGTFLFAVPRA